MNEPNYNPTITVEIDIRDSIDIEVDLHTILSAINELPITLKWNVVGGILRNLKPEADDLTAEQKELIKKFLNETLTRLS